MAETWPHRLRDGTPAHVRPLTPDDRDELVRGFDRLSEQSRYERFLMPLRELPPQWVHRLVDDVDGVRHVALVLEVPDEHELSGRTAVGVGRFVRDADAPERAEVAVTVVDDWHGRGAGSLLTRLLGDAARALGVRLFTASMHAANEPSLRMLRHAGAVRRVRSDPGVIEVEVDLTTAGTRPPRGR